MCEGHSDLGLALADVVSAQALTREEGEESCWLCRVGMGPGGCLRKTEVCLG